MRLRQDQRVLLGNLKSAAVVGTVLGPSMSPTMLGICKGKGSENVEIYNECSSMDIGAKNDLVLVSPVIKFENRSIVEPAILFQHAHATYFLNCC